MTYTRKTWDEYEVQGYFGYGWEMVTTEDTWKDAKLQRQCYRDNDPKHVYRIIKKRIKIMGV